jgi:histidinol-phosphate/aromatic aminotransferase/cobyric acid decarboxylase-like protein
MENLIKSVQAILSTTPARWIKLVDSVPPGVLLALDEAYFEFLDEPLDLLPEIRNGSKPNLLLMRTFSKIYGLAGLRIGYGVGHADFIAALEKIRQPFNINSVAQAGALAALEASLLAGDVSKNTHDTILKQMDDPQVTGMRVDDPAHPPNLGVLAGLLMGSPEFQRR